MKKIREIMLAGLIVCLCASCGGGAKNTSGTKDSGDTLLVGSNAEFPLKEKVTYNVVQRRGDANRSFGELDEWNDYYEKKSNIHINWLDWGVADAYTQKLKLAVASGDIPDAFYGGFLFSPQEYVNYGTANILVPIEDLIETYMPNYSRLISIKPDLKKGVKAPDGHIYGVPSYLGILSGAAQTNDVILYNKVWLDKLGLDIPETKEEFHELLKAIKAAGDLNGNGKNDEIPFTFHFGTGGTIDHINGLASFLGFENAMLPSNYFLAENGTVKFAPSQPGVKEAMKYMNMLNNENLIDKEAFTMESNSYTAKTRNPVPVAGVLIGWSEYNINAVAGEGTYVYGKPLKDRDGNRHWLRRVRPVSETISFAITNKAKHPELLAKWADLHLDVDASVYNTYGTFDKYVKKLGEGEYEEILTPDGKQQDLSGVVPLNFSLSILLPEDAKFAKVPQNTLSKNEANDIYCPYMSEETFMDGYSTAEEIERNSIISNDVKNYVTKTLAKWIYSGGVEEEWDTYLKELDNMKVDEWTKNIQAAYDRTK